MKKKVFKRAIVDVLVKQLTTYHDHIHCIIGPRQVGKTTASEQIQAALNWPTVMVSADNVLTTDYHWIETQWNRVFRLFEQEKKPVLLIIDEIQKIPNWSESLKAMWDQHKAIRENIRVLILGSSSLLIQKGLTESLAGRFILTQMTHWSFVEMKEAFGWNLDQWLYFGGYPGAAIFAQNDERQWKSYVRDSLIETVLSKDILQLQTIHKPILLKQLFVLAASVPSQIVSYTKLLGQLHDAGNVTTLAHYIALLESAFLISGLSVFSKGIIRTRGSIPKFVIWNNALVHALSLYSFSETLSNRTAWGRCVENAVGAHVINHLSRLDWEISYWRKGDKEVDFVVSKGDRIWAIEVKSGLKTGYSGIAAFKAVYPHATPLIVGGNGIPLEEFFSTSPETLFR